MPRLLLLAAAPPPAPPDHAWASPLPRFLWQVEEGPSSAKRWTALPREPRRGAKSRPEAGRRPGPLENGPPTTDQPAVEMAPEAVPLIAFQRQRRHSNLGTASRTNPANAPVLLVAHCDTPARVAETAPNRRKGQRASVQAVRRGRPVPV